MDEFNSFLEIYIRFVASSYPLIIQRQIELEADDWTK